MESNWFQKTPIYAAFDGWYMCQILDYKIGMAQSVFLNFSAVGTGTLTYEPHHEKTCLQGLQPWYTQTGLLNFRS